MLIHLYTTDEHASHLFLYVKIWLCVMHNSASDIDCLFVQAVGFFLTTRLNRLDGSILGAHYTSENKVTVEFRIIASEARIVVHCRVSTVLRITSFGGLGDDIKAVGVTCCIGVVRTAFKQRSFVQLNFTIEYRTSQTNAPPCCSHGYLMRLRWASLHAVPTQYRNSGAHHHSTLPYLVSAVLSPPR